MGYFFFHRLSKYVDPKNHCYASLKIDPKLSKIEFTPMWKSQVYVIVTKIPTLPDFWECALNSSGRPFYINHATRTTQWEAPWAIPYPPILKTPPMVNLNIQTNKKLSQNNTPHHHHQQQQPKKQTKLHFA